MPIINKFKCPECGSRYATPALLGMHRAKKHGIAGQSQSSIVKRLLAHPQPTETPAENQCRLCGFTAKTKSGYSVHIRTYHEPKTETPAEDKSPAGVERWSKLRGDYPCPHCKFVAKWTGGLTYHMKRLHPEGSVAIVRTTKAEVTRAVRAEEESHAVTNGHAGIIPDAALAVALGRYQGLCQSFATEYDLPPRMFAARLAELIYNTQVRSTSRSGLRLSAL